MVSNRDIGFVPAGQDAEIKVDTFNFTRYGLIHGQCSASPDAITRDRPGGHPCGTPARGQTQRAGARNWSTPPACRSTAPRCDRG